MKRLIALRPVLYLSKQYSIGDELPVNDAPMVDAWIRAKSAKWDEGTGAAPDPAPVISDTVPEASEPEPEVAEAVPEAVDPEPEVSETVPEASDSEPKASETEPKAEAKQQKASSGKDKK